MLVYVVMASNGEDTVVTGIFDTEAKANACREEENKFAWGGAWVDVWEVE